MTVLTYAQCLEHAGLLPDTRRRTYPTHVKFRKWGPMTMATESAAGPAPAEDALDAFDYQAPTDEQTQRIRAIRQTLKDVRDQLQNLIPRSRELSMAITKLEEVSMWANKGVVFNGERPQPHP